MRRATRHAIHALRARRRQAGVTLIELMVALVIGLLLTGAVFGVLATFEGRKRTLTSGNDVEQAGQLAMYKIDHWLRSAGAGLPQAADFAYGCPLHAARAGRQLLPRGAAIEAPFDHVDPGDAGVFRLAPVLILPGQTSPNFSGQRSDVLVLMAGVPSGGVAAPFAEAASAAALSLAYAGDFAGDDLALVVDQPGDGGTRRPCLLTQVQAGFKGTGSTLPLAGDYHAANVGDASLAAYTDHASALRLGAPAGSGAPQFLLLGVGDGNVLYSYDLLQTGAAPLQAQADGVFEMHALYGVDSDGDGKVDRWASPADGDYAHEVLTAGDELAARRLQQIRAVRVGLLMRSALPEKNSVTAGDPVLFAELGALAFTRPLTDAERHFRYRTIEQTVPVRNNLLIGDE